MMLTDDQPTVIEVIGDLLFSTVVPTRDTVLDQVVKCTNRCVLDFKKVGRVDSTALSLWLCCMRSARENNISLEVCNIPDDMLSIAKLVGIEDQLI